MEVQFVLGEEAATATQLQERAAKVPTGRLQCSCAPPLTIPLSVYGSEMSPNGASNGCGVGGFALATAKTSHSGSHLLRFIEASRTSSSNAFPSLASPRSGVSGISRSILSRASDASGMAAVSIDVHLPPLLNNRRTDIGAGQVVEPMASSNTRLPLLPRQVTHIRAEHQYLQQQCEIEHRTPVHAHLCVKMMPRLKPITARDWQAK